MPPQIHTGTTFLKEYKIALINEVVTGNVDVREVPIPK